MTKNLASGALGKLAPLGLKTFFLAIMERTYLLKTGSFVMIVQMVIAILKCHKLSKFKLRKFIQLKI
jgi:hypothetical protein